MAPRNEIMKLISLLERAYFEESFIALGDILKPVSFLVSLVENYNWLRNHTLWVEE